MAMEYHKPGTPIRAKEQALNFACSFLRPIEPTLRATLATAIASQPIMLNAKLGQEMTNELEMHYVDPSNADIMGDDQGGHGGGEPAGPNAMA